MSNQMTNSIVKGDGNLQHNFDKEYRMNTKGYSEEDNIILINYSQESDLKRVYKELFGKAQEEYNAKQKRKDRQIPDYYEHIKKGKQEKLFFELIITCGNCIDNANDEELQIEMLKEIHEKVTTDYPNMRFFGSTIHLDEKGVPHLHLDYIPFVTNSKKGLSTRISMDGALKEMGFKPERPRLRETYHDKYGNEKDKRMSLFNAWRNSISDTCNQIYKKHDVELIHLDNGRQVHLSQEQYEREQAIKMASKELAANPTKEVITQMIDNQIQEFNFDPEKPFEQIETKDITEYEAFRLPKREAREELITKIREVKQLSSQYKELYNENQSMREVLAVAKYTRNAFEKAEDKLESLKIENKELKEKNFDLKSEYQKLEKKFDKLGNVFAFFVKRVQNIFFAIQNFLSAEQKENNKDTIKKMDNIRNKEPVDVILDVTADYDDFTEEERKRIEEDLWKEDNARYNEDKENDWLDYDR